MSNTVAQRYVVRREVARGGMGTVLAAQHLFTGRTVALKLVSDSVKQPQVGRARLLREARLLGALKHPNVVNILDAGHCETHGPYVALEMLDGRSLDGLLTTRGKLAVSDVLAIGLALTSALSAAHSCGVVHRDVKPANVFVAAQPEGEVIKLIDFGIASEMNSDPEPDSKLTRPGDILGTLEYVAPEQLTNASLATPESDVYSVASLLYECVAGELPPLIERLAAPPALHRAVELRPDAPLELIELIIQGLHPDPKRRLMSARPMFDALTAIAGGERPRSRLLEGLPPETRGVTSSDSPTLSEPATARAQSRRRFARAPYITPCRVVRDGRPPIDGRSEDISEGGLLLLIPQSLSGDTPDQSESLPRSGEAVRVRFALPTSGVVAEQAAHVRWARDARGRAAMGLEFIELSKESAESIATYVTIVGGGAPQSTASDSPPAPSPS